MPLRQTQQQKQQQKQRLTPRQEQLAMLLDTPNTELRDVVQREVDENPALEWDNSPMDENDDVRHDITVDDVAQRDDAGQGSDDDWEPQHYNQERDRNMEHYERPVVATDSFRNRLRQQLSGMELSEQEEFVANYVIENIDDDGYLRVSNGLIRSNIMAQFYRNVEIREIEHVIVDVIQHLFPPGICARNLRECLLIQLRQQQQESENPLLRKAVGVIEKHFDDFSKRKYEQIRRREGLSEQQFAEIQALIRLLNPSPGDGIAPDYVIPDFIITNDNGQLRLSLANEYTPRLRINDDYQKMLEKMRSKRNQEALAFIRRNIDSANVFIESLPERNRTMYLVMNEILNRQYAYFLTGNRELLKPMVQRNVAERVNLDVSTVSRVVSSRNVQTDFGVIPLKALFTEAIDDEGDISSAAVKEYLRELVENEDKTHPLPDEKLAELLKEKGYSISRRTVAKYREQLGIFSSGMRKEK